MNTNSGVLTASNILVTNIQRFSLHDGPGIRTTVFFKLCSLCCPWCSNPENLEDKIQDYIKDGVTGSYGKYYNTEELYSEVIKDKPFYNGEINEYQITDPSLLEKLPGGITFSGGEALLQIKQLEPLLQKLNKEHIHIAVETCLFVPEENLNTSLQYIDIFYVDIKILDKDNCRKYLHGQLDIYLSNLKILMQSEKPVVIRVPVIGGYTDGVDNRKAVFELISSYVKEGANILKVELIKEHNLGINKYRSLSDAGNVGFDIPEYKGVSDELMEVYKKEIEKIGIWTEVCKV